MTSNPNLRVLSPSRNCSPHETPPAGDQLTPKGLLVAPMLTNRLPWSHGYFKTVGHAPLAASDVVLVHCFRDSRGRFYDEYSHQPEVPCELVGQWRLESFRTIDDAVSDALRIRRAPG